MPASLTDTTTSLPCSSVRRSIRPPRVIYLAALLSRFQYTCDSRVRSASTTTGPAGSSTVSSWPHSSMSGRLVSTAPCTTFDRRTGSRLSSMLPRLMRLKSIRSSISRARCRTCRSMTSRAHCNSGIAGPFRWRISTAFRTGASGLRSSWASVARNSSLRRSDFAQRLLRLLAVGDVQHSAAHPQRRPSFVESAFAPDLGPTYTAIQIKHAKFVAILPALASRLERGDGARAIVRMHACEPGVVAQLALAGFSAEQSPRFLRSMKPLPLRDLNPTLRRVPPVARAPAAPRSRASASVRSLTR